MNLLSKKMALIALSIFVLSSCKQETPLTPDRSDNGVVQEMEAHFYKVPGSQGIFGEYMIAANDGSDLQPVIVDENNIDMNEIYDGMAVRLSFFYICDKDSKNVKFKKTITDSPCEDFQLVHISKITRSKHPWEKFGEEGTK